MKRKSKDIDDIKMDMTPMIDVVFNLIIFFMLVTQMVTIERAELELPRANKAREEQATDSKQLVINVHRKPEDGKWIEVAGRKYTWAEFSDLLQTEANDAKPSSDDPSERQVLVRGDIDTPYRMIQRVMLECAKKKIYKLSFAAKIQSDE